MSKVTTLKGKVIDIAALRETHGASISLGNTKTNARGDVLGRGGVVVQTREEVAKAYYAHNPKAVTVTAVSLKDITDEAVMTPAEAIAALQDAAKTPDKPTSRRKIKDSED